MKRNAQNSYAEKYKNKTISKSVNIRKKPRYTESKTSNEESLNIINNNPTDLILENHDKKPFNNSISRNNNKSIQILPLTYYEENNYFNLLKQERDKLSKYLNENSETNIKLIGNERYKHIPLNKFVKDQKINLPENKMGLIPIPLRSVQRKSKEDLLG